MALFGTALKSPEKSAKASGCYPPRMEIGTGSWVSLSGDAELKLWCLLCLSDMAVRRLLRGLKIRVMQSEGPVGRVTWCRNSLCYLLHLPSFWYLALSYGMSQLKALWRVDLPCYQCGFIDRTVRCVLLESYFEKENIPFPRNLSFTFPENTFFFC